jgi:membrane-bound inhibitor of C-type lysozyme
MPFSSRLAAAAIALSAAGAFASGCAAAPADSSPSAAGTQGPSVTLLTYRCESGALIRATYPTDRIALVRYRDRTHELEQAQAASGVRYIDDDLQWWTRGNGPGASAILSRPSEDADAASPGAAGGEVIETCKQSAASD